MTNQNAPSTADNHAHCTSDISARRDFLYYATAGAGAVATGAAAWPFINSMNPSADVTALSSVEVDLDGVEVGTRITLKWNGKPVFIDRRTQEQIALARADDGADLIDPALDADRAERPEWLIVIGICTHLAACRLVSTVAIRLGIGKAGSAPATDLITILPDGFAKARRRATLICRPTPS